MYQILANTTYDIVYDKTHSLSLSLSLYIYVVQGVMPNMMTCGQGCLFLKLQMVMVGQSGMSAGKPICYSFQ